MSFLKTLWTIKFPLALLLLAGLMTYTQMLRSAYRNELKIMALQKTNEADRTIFKRSVQDSIIDTMLIKQNNELKENLNEANLRKMEAERIADINKRELDDTVRLFDYARVQWGSQIDRATREAVDRYAEAATTTLGECAAEYTKLAGEADRYLARIDYVTEVHNSLVDIVNNIPDKTLYTINEDYSVTIGDEESAKK